MTDESSETSPEGAPQLRGFQQFEFALTDALISQLVSVLDKMNTAPLTTNLVSCIPNGQGIYQLFLDDQLVYIGKTDSDAGLAARLAKHESKVSGRPNLRGKVRFKAVQVLVFSAMELETMLIRHYKGQLGSVAWQHSGFGSNDPGRERDTTKYKDDHFDIQHPIDIDEQASYFFSAGTPMKDALKGIKDQLPYTFRFAQSSETSTTKLSQDITGHSVRDLLEKLVVQLPTGWQATKLPGYVILYKEQYEYTYGETIGRT